MKTVALIPARSGSKGVPEKNIKVIQLFVIIEDYSLFETSICVSNSASSRCSRSNSK